MVVELYITANSGHSRVLHIEISRKNRGPGNQNAQAIKRAGWTQLVTIAEENVPSNPRLMPYSAPG